MDEDQTVSVSKGVFIFKNGLKASTGQKKSRGLNVQLSHNPWYTSYQKLWASLEEKLEDLNNEIFSTVLSNLVMFVSKSYGELETEIPTAALLTGVNMPDHKAQFLTLTKQIKEQVTPHVACLYGQDCQNLKYFVENMINQFINEEHYFDDEMDMDTSSQTTQIKKSNFSFALLQSWYEDLYHRSPVKSPKKQKLKKKALVVIIPDFESFNPKVIQEFILIASSYINILPFVIVFGIATSITTLHTSLPYQVTSKISVQVFHSKRSIDYLNKILEEVFFTLDCPFQLGGNVFNLFTDIFLFYDFSVSGFIQNIKYAMLEHYSYGNSMALCTESKKEIKQLIKGFSHEDCENARQLLSFRKLVEKETHENRIKLLMDDAYFKRVLEEEVYKLRKYIRRLHIFLKSLNTLVSDLPKAPLGKYIRELYSVATAQNITKTPEFKECFQLLNFQSKEELCKKVLTLVNDVSSIVNTSYNKPNKLQEFVLTLSQFIEDMKLLEVDNYEILNDVTNVDEEQISGHMNRMQLKEKLKGMSRQSLKPLNQYEKIRQKILNYLEETFEMYLVEPSSMYFYEIFFFNDVSIRSHIIGEHRSAVHAALNNPHHYLQCTCCDCAETTVIRPTMPDISIAYKLHLECGRMINLYDWLQAFLSVIDPSDVDDETKRVVKPEFQARFTQAVQELEFIGFIKSSKRKADHVTRTTWGG